MNKSKGSEYFCTALYKFIMIHNYFWEQRGRGCLSRHQKRLNRIVKRDKNCILEDCNVFMVHFIYIPFLFNQPSHLLNSSNSSSVPLQFRKSLLSSVSSIPPSPHLSYSSSLHGSSLSLSVPPLHFSSSSPLLPYQSEQVAAGQL